MQGVLASHYLYGPERILSQDLRLYTRLAPICKDPYTVPLQTGWLGLKSLYANVASQVEAVAKTQVRTKAKLGWM